MPISKNVVITQEYPLTSDFFDDWTESHRRWSCYHHYGVACCVPGCDRKGTKVVHWYSQADFTKYGDSGKGEHIELVGVDLDGSEFIMTVDHIVPDSKGGPKVWWNLQPMCEFHNHDQGSKMLHRPNRARIFELMEHSNIRLPQVMTDQELLDSVVAHYEKQLKKDQGKFRRIKDKY